MHSLCLLYFIHHLNASPDFEVHTIPGIRLLSNRFSFSAGDFNIFTYQEEFCLAIAADRKRFAEEKANEKNEQKEELYE